MNNGNPMTFRLLDLSLHSPIENLALDEALLEEADEGHSGPVLRLWESDRYFVVLGRSSNPSDDVDIGACQRDDIPILRRASGGGTVIQGPGCLSYALVIPLALHMELRDIRSSNLFILRRVANALSRWQPAVALEGISDLAVGGRKISGSAQRRTKNTLLFHGTVLHGMPAAAISRYLKEPKRQPDYRRSRPHAEFLSTIDAPIADIKQAIASSWNADGNLEDWPRSRMTRAISAVAERSMAQDGTSTPQNMNARV